MQTSMLRGSSQMATSRQARPARSRAPCTIECNKRVQKKAKVIYSTGEIKMVPYGFWRNYLLPRREADLVSEGVLKTIRMAKEDEIRSAMEVKAQAQSFANALSTIGKFQIRKKVGERDQIYGSVQKSEVADAIYQQTGRQLESGDITVPEIKAVGTYECTVQLHPEVVGRFSVVIQREKGLSIKTTEPKKKK